VRAHVCRQSGESLRGGVTVRKLTDSRKGLVGEKLDCPFQSGAVLDKYGSCDGGKAG